jgi:alginate O-acetyltransferase complex protein AlgI
MLFISYEFIFYFLPISVLGFYLLGRFGFQSQVLFLILCSLIYYGWWRIEFLWILSGSIIFNYVVGVWLDGHKSKSILGLAIATNLLLLGWFKYRYFIFENSFANFSDSSLGQGLLLPLGISFFTFQQVSYLVDSYSDKTIRHNFYQYALFVVFFPQLIAGPIVHQAEMLRQFQNSAASRKLFVNFSIGATIFILGLFKKVGIADQIAQYSTPVFNAASSGQTMTLLEAWGGAYAYTFQLYFDFSGYSDMAIGLARLFGIRLPLNFNSPYKATDIIDFWRRWHMTLSRFLRDYLYVPLGGNRQGTLRRYVNLIIVMLLGGLWHGAGWTFLVWGLMHGIFLVINHAWRWCRIVAFGDPAFFRSRLWTKLAWLLTFHAVVLAWVTFRATDWQVALAMYEGMFNFNGVLMPDRYAAALGPLQGALSALGIGFTDAPVQLYGVRQMAITLACMVGVLVLPNTEEWMARYRPTVERLAPSTGLLPRWAIWRPSMRWSIPVCLLFVLALYFSSTNISEFLYFDF